MTTKFKPRWYQAESVQATIDYYFEGGEEDGIICLPTGSGKSYTLCNITKEILERIPSARIMVLTHVKELIKQNYDSMKSFWPAAPCGIYSAGLKRKESNKQITFAGVASIAKQSKLFGTVNVVIIDECHMISDVGNTQYRKFISVLRETNPKLRVIGLTATPYRLGMGSLLDGGLFTHKLYDGCSMTAINRMIDEGFLSDLIPKSTSIAIDTSTITKRGGEFTPMAANAAIDKDEITMAAVAEIVEMGKDRNHWMIFAQSLEHCGHIMDYLNEFGVGCVEVHSKITTTERDENIANFKSGKVKALVNVGVLTTGFDFPALDMLAILRLTESTALWLQILGRGMRVHPSKVNCLVLDFAGNTKRLGCVNDPVLPRKKGEKGGGVAPVKECPECETIVHASARVCKECGHEFPRQQNILTTAASDVLVKRKLIDYQTVDVRSTSYSIHKKTGKPDMIKVSYGVGLMTIHDYLYGFESGKAYNWIKEHIKWGEHYPIDAEQFMKATEMFKKPKQIVIDAANKFNNVQSRVWADTSSNYPF